jgi:hypothetical protein
MAMPGPPGGGPQQQQQPVFRQTVWTDVPAPPATAYVRADRRVKVTGGSTLFFGALALELVPRLGSDPTRWEVLCFAGFGVVALVSAITWLVVRRHASTALATLTGAGQTVTQTDYFGQPPTGPSAQLAPRPDLVVLGGGAPATVGNPSTERVGPDV